MSGTAAPPVSTRPGWVDWLFRRQLDYYPENRARVTYLAITVLATITLYYELYVGGSVSTLVLANLNMSFTFFVLTLAFGALIGAFGSLFAGLTDRFGRANLVVFGLFFTAIFVAFIIPTATNKWSFTIYGFVVGFVEGVGHDDGLLTPVEMMYEPADRNINIYDYRLKNVEPAKV